MSHSKFSFAEDEREIHTWTMLYISPAGDRYNGKLTITNKRLLYDATFDGSGKGLLPETVSMKWGGDGYLKIDKKDIKDVQADRSLLSKKAILTLIDGSKHIFNYGAMNIDKVVAAMNDR